MTAVLAALAVTVLAVVVLASGRRGQEPEVRRVPVNLNGTLTNEMSDTSALEGFDRIVNDYMTAWGLKGVSLSVMRNDSLLYAHGFGMADSKVPMEPGHILRMASVSKLVTAIGIMVLEEKGLLTLDDKVFGPDGILNDSIYNAAIKDTLYYRML